MATCPKCAAFYFDAANCAADGSPLLLDEVARNQGIQPIAAGRYGLISVLGEGGMGTVFLATHLDLNRQVALKILRKQGSHAQAIERFKREARAASLISHRHVVSIMDFGELPDGSLYCVMEYLQGKNLSIAIDNEGPFTIGRTFSIAIQIAKGLQAAHQKGVVHRDLKPDNIFLLDKQEYPDFVKVLDFGIAKLNDFGRITKTGMLLGTPDYMSPEQAMGKDADIRSDIYALGVLMFEMLVGDRPFHGESFMAVLSQHLYAPTPKLQERRPAVAFPPECDAIIQKAMAKAPELRYDSMESLLVAMYQIPKIFELLPAVLTQSIRKTTSSHLLSQKLFTAIEQTVPLPKVTEPLSTQKISEEAHFLDDTSTDDGVKSKNSVHLMPTLPPPELPLPRIPTPIETQRSISAQQTALIVDSLDSMATIPTSGARSLTNRQLVDAVGLRNLRGQQTSTAIDVPAVEDMQTSLLEETVPGHTRIAERPQVNTAPERAKSSPALDVRPVVAATNVSSLVTETIDIAATEVEGVRSPLAGLAVTEIEGLQSPLQSQNSIAPSDKHSGDDELSLLTTRSIEKVKPLSPEHIATIPFAGDAEEEDNEGSRVLRVFVWFFVTMLLAGLLWALWMKEEILPQLSSLSW